MREAEGAEDNLKQRVSPLVASLALDETSEATRILRWAAHQPWLDGSEPFLVETRIEQAVAAAEVVPDGFIVTRAVTSDEEVSVEARKQGVSLVIETGSEHTRVRASGVTNEEATAACQAVRDAALKQIKRDRVAIRTWSFSSYADWDDRLMSAPQWDEIRRNYPPRVRKSLEPLFARTEAPVNAGKLVLWHGAPGTGKTTAIRALARSWEPWCAMQYISDPERLFADSGYLSEVLSQAARNAKGPTLTSASRPDDTWKLIVAEDTDEYLRTTARAEAGASLGRVLNLSDGILGEHRNVILLLTTNEEVSRLHPAIVRPGRALAEVHFSAFSAREATTWLGDAAPKPQRSMTLAELLAVRGDISTTTSSAGEEPSIGAYL